jgi:hypothetical protein
MAIRDEQGFNRYYTTITGLVAGIGSVFAHGLDTSKIVKIDIICDGTVDTNIVPNGNPMSGLLGGGGPTATSDYTVLLDSTNVNLVLPGGSTNITGGTIHIKALLKP